MNYQSTYHATVIQARHATEIMYVLRLWQIATCVLVALIFLSIKKGKCDSAGNCVCQPGYTGARCDKVEACNTGYCLNHAECEEIDDEPYRRCM